MYYLPRKGGMNDAGFSKAGLGDRLNAGPRWQRPGAAGPDGGTGLLACRDGEMPRYAKEGQRWQRLDQTWVGLVEGEQPLPADLLRPEPIDGHLVKLGDGNEWLIPTARKCPTGTALPQAVVLGPDGGWITEALPQYASFWTKAGAIFDAFCKAQTEKSAVLEDAIDIAIEALAFNYYVGPAEVSLLRLFTTTNVWRDVCGAIIDWPSWVEYAADEAAKKNLTAPPADPPDGK
jgi:hypothetical protein